MEQPARGGEEAAAGLVRGGGHLTDHLGDGRRLASRDVGTKRPFTLASPSTDAGPSRSKSIRIDDNDNAKNISEDFEESAVVTDEKEGEDKTKRTRSKEEKENLEESAVVTDEKEREDKTKRTRSKEEKENLTKQFVRKSLTVKKKISELENYVKKTGTAELEYMVIIKDNVHSKGHHGGVEAAGGPDQVHRAARDGTVVGLSVVSPPRPSSSTTSNRPACCLLSTWPACSSPPPSPHCSSPTLSPILATKGDSGH